MSSMTRYTLKKKSIMQIMILTTIPILLSLGYFSYALVSESRRFVFYKLENAAYQSNAILASRMHTIQNTFFTLVADKSLNNSILSVHEQRRAGVDRNSLEILAQEDLVRARLVSSLFFNQVWENELIRSVMVYVDPDHFYIYSYYISQSKTLVSVMNRWVEQASGERLFMQELMPPGADNPNIYYVRNYLYQGLPVYILFEISEEKLFASDTLGQLYHDTEKILFDADGTILSHEDKTLLGTQVSPELLDRIDEVKLQDTLIKGREFYSISKRIDGTEMIADFSIPRGTVWSLVNENILGYLLIIIPVLLLFIGISAVLGRKLTVHISDLVENIKRIGKGEYDARMPEYREAELAELSQIFNAMTQRIDVLINNVYEKQLLLREAELESLRAQIHPHFLFNVLMTIGIRARLAKNEQIYQMITSLSQLMHASIFGSFTDTVTLEEEMRVVNYYLFLQRERFGEAIRIDVEEVPEYIRTCQVPKLCLLPLVDNAIVHGFKDIDHIGVLAMRFHAAEGAFSIEVRDNGCGFDPDTINLNRKPIPERSETRHAHIGMINTHKRIELVFGQGYGLQVESTIGEGTVIMVNLPVVKAESGEAAKQGALLTGEAGPG